MSIGFIRCKYKSLKFASWKVTGIDAGRLKIKIHAPPQDGKANKMLMKFLAKLCEVAVSDLSVDKGMSSRLKTIIIEKEADKVMSLIKMHLKNNA